MQHDVEKYLADVLGAARDIQSFVGAKSFEEYHADKLTKAAVERKFEIIGEALNRLAKLAPETARQVREFDKIIAFRNVVIHGYDVVSDPIVWDVITNRLSILIEDVEKLQ